MQASSSSEVKVYPLNETAVTVSFGDSFCPAIHKKVRLLSLSLEKQPLPEMVEYIPSYTGVTIFYNPMQVETTRGNKPVFELVKEKVEKLLSAIDQETEDKPRTIEIPVYYGGETGPDLGNVATHNGLTPQEVIEIHSSENYLVYMIGFAPGFPYLGGMSEKISTPRLDNPRTCVPSGSVGIAGAQTGVYSLSTPGGWQIIGRTPLSLFDTAGDPLTLLESGDIVRFKPISKAEYQVYEEVGK
ncbi:5-oxoprolinase subunit PxpB [Bacillus sp. FJAT-44742]|uniref:5-oxoprolinase subunit PxpB n=1 Tax=Bacillus sp. FJAT-44742 TaxID=2014005 RepID=UPI000C249BFD|nr:5-oxoprolinase subunit PxpB [Bacillus sp. FJAT-44742]